MKYSAHKYSQSGMVMVEVLIALLIFALAVLGMVGINAFAVTSQSDAQYRTEANKFAMQMINQIMLSVPRATASLSNTTDMANAVTAFDHYADAGVGAACSGTGTASVNPAVVSWVSAIQGTNGLPGSVAGMQQILTNADGILNEVTVTVCWQAPGDTSVRRHVMQAVIN